MLFDYRYTREWTQTIEDLSSDLEEADTKVALHVQHAFTTSEGPVIVHSPSGDTDIAVIL